MTDTPSDITDGVQAALDHAWRWFALVAGQRMQIIYYFFVAISIVAAAFAASFNAHNDGASATIGLVGVVLSAGFWGLEARTQQLVRSAERALREIEVEFAQSTGFTVVQIAMDAHVGSNAWLSYGTIIRAITALSLTAFSAGAIVALVH